MIPDITIAGVGVAAVVQVTPQTERRIRQCREALHVDSGAGTEEFLAKRCEVTLSNSSTCTLPRATAYDHHEGALRVAEKTMLWVDSPRHEQPDWIGAGLVSASKQMTHMMDSVSVRPCVLTPPCERRAR